MESNNLDVDEETVHFYRWYRLVNTFDTEILRFSGWIAIKGLPFGMWNEEIFKYIGNKAKAYKKLTETPRTFPTYQRPESKLMLHPCLKPVISSS